MTSIMDAAPALAPRVRELAPATEDGRRLPEELARAFGEVGIWRACIPEAAGGLEVDLMTLVSVLSELSAADGSAGWCAMIGATSGLVYAYLDQAIAKEIVSAEPSFCTGGVFAPSGRAVLVDGGCRVDGRWSFSSGAHHTTWFSLGVVMMDADAPRILANGAPDVRGILVPSSDVEILDTWYVSGLRGTGSNDVAVHDVFVPEERIYRLVGGTPASEGTLYRFPLFGLLALGVASVAVGIARDAIDELITLATEKTPSGSRRRLADRAHAQMEVAQAKAELAAAESFIIGEGNLIWYEADEGKALDVEARARLRLAATHGTRTSARVVDRMYELGGGTSIYATSRLQRAFRDIHAATQHMVVAPATYELTGRVLLGVETDVSQL